MQAMEFDKADSKAINLSKLDFKFAYFSKSFVVFTAINLSKLDFKYQKRNKVG